MSTTFAVRPIAWVESRRAEVADDDWVAVISRIVLDSERFGVDALRGLRGANFDVPTGSLVRA